MKFGTIPLKNAEGAILAHSLKAGKRRLKKGRILTPGDLELLEAAGYGTIMAAQLEAGDFGEDEAAAALAETAAGPHVALGTAATGRCNLYAADKGIALLDAGAIDAFNGVDEAVTLSTVRPYQMVEPGQLIGTVKIITFGVAKSVIDKVRSFVSKGDPLLAVAPYQPFRAGLIQTVLPGAKQSLIDKTIEVSRHRLSNVNGTLEETHVCPHEEDALATELGKLAKAGCDVILVLGASATVDRRDVVPAAVSRAGGTVEHFGMPVDPGNLMVLAALGDSRILGLPGSARSSRLHGFDWILSRLAANLDVTGDDLMGMGVGGLLKEIPGRPLPRAKAAPLKASAPARRSSRIAALVLAAGQSRRMGSVNKLLAQIDGETMVHRTVSAVLGSAADPVIVVTGHEEDRVKAALASLPVAFAHNEGYAEGLSTSLRAGILALPEGIDAVLVCLGDMPEIDPNQLDRLIAGFDPASGQEICVPVHGGKRGNPVLWGQRFFADMAALEGDVGARHLIGEHADMVVEVEMDDDATLTDVDTPAALAKLSARRAKAR